MDAFDFNNNDREYQKDLEKMRKEIEEDVKNEGITYDGYAHTNPEAQADWKVKKYPSTYKEQEQAKKQQEDIQERKRKAIAAEVEQRLMESEKRQILERNYWGELGRQHALEQAKRETQIQNFKSRQRIREAEERQQKKVIDKSHTVKVIQEQYINRAVEQDNVHSIDVKSDFNVQHKHAKIRVSMDEKVQAFKARQRRREANEREAARLAKLEDKRISSGFNTGTDKTKDSRSIEDKPKTYDEKEKDHKAARKEAFKQEQRETLNKDVIEKDNDLDIE